MKPLAYAYPLLIDTTCGPAPVGYVTRCGLPVLYGTWWRVLHGDFALRRKAVAYQRAI